MTRGPQKGRAPRPCLVCGTPTIGTRCTSCEASHQHARYGSRPHYQGDWSTVSRKIRDEHVERNGWVCPGWDTDPHPATDLVVDHVTARSRVELAVLCRSCNSRKAATERTPR